LNQEISGDRYFKTNIFSTIYVFCLQRLKKADKFTTKNKYSEKKRCFMSQHHPGMTQTVHPKLQKKYMISVSCRQQIFPKMENEWFKCLHGTFLPYATPTMPNWPGGHRSPM